MFSQETSGRVQLEATISGEQLGHLLASSEFKQYTGKDRVSILFYIFYMILHALKRVLRAQGLTYSLELVTSTTKFTNAVSFSLLLWLLIPTAFIFAGKNIS